MIKTIAFSVLMAMALVGCATPGGDSKFALECGDGTAICIMNVADRQSGVSGTDRQIITDPDNVSVGDGDQEVNSDTSGAAIITDPDNVRVDSDAADGAVRRALGVLQ